jgi:hypothetical protein
MDRDEKQVFFGPTIPPIPPILILALQRLISEARSGRIWPIPVLHPPCTFAMA